jgi:hypothetical protein
MGSFFGKRIIYVTGLILGIFQRGLIGARVSETGS